MWVISPRFECPTFNFNSEDNLSYVADSDMPCGTGIWGGYGTIPSNQEGIIDRLNQFEPNWNSLNYHTVNEILQHPWYTRLLGASWDPDHELHFARCIRTCAKNKAYHNEINVNP